MEFHKTGGPGDIDRMYKMFDELKNKEKAIVLQARPDILDVPYQFTVTFGHGEFDLPEIICTSPMDTAAHVPFLEHALEHWRKHPALVGKSIDAHELLGTEYGVNADSDSITFKFVEFDLDPDHPVAHVWHQVYVAYRKYIKADSLTFGIPRFMQMVFGINDRYPGEVGGPRNLNKDGSVYQPLLYE
jgi:hypothetical protein